jgi:Rod binding domain-containing protein
LPPGDSDTKAAATRFEALVLAQLLKSARAARLSDGPLNGQGGDWQAMADEALAGLLARGSPLGLGRMLAAAVAEPPAATDPGEPR